MKICVGANKREETISNRDLLITPLNKNTTDGMTDSASALNRLFFLQQTTHITQYNATSSASAIR